MRRLILSVAFAAAMAFAVSPAAARVQRSYLTVPLDRSGQVPGHVRLFLERFPPRGSGSGRGALFALAGGPGQAATQFAGDFRDVLEPALEHRQLVLFDERGTGRSEPLRCPASLARDTVPPLSAVSSCAAQLGPRRAFYTTRDSADDLEAVRQSIGVDRISLYGGSYGTYTALTYARRYPQHVESLILDSTVAPEGIDPLDRATYAAVPRMLRDVCSQGACRSVTPDPVSDLARVVSDLTQRPRLGSAFDGRGAPQLVRMNADAVHDMVLAADMDPVLASELPSVFRSAANGDEAPLARELRAFRATGGDLGGPGPDLDGGENVARICEEADMPWPRASDQSARRDGLAAAVLGAGADAFAPWSTQTEIDRGTAAECLGWPVASLASPALSGPLPDVPTLILSGAEDMRTPLENAQEVASMIPGAAIVTVPRTGHGALESACGLDALDAFEAHRPMPACRARPSESPPVVPPAPLSLGQVTPARGVGGTPGRTLEAVNMTLDDASLQFLAGIFEAGPLPAVGGLRGGFERFGVRHGVGGLIFHHYSYVPGVTITGTLGVSLRRKAIVGRLVVGGSAATHGVLRLGEHGRLTGLIGRYPVSVSDTSRAKAMMRCDALYRGWHALSTRRSSPFTGWVIHRASGFTTCVFSTR